MTPLRPHTLFENFLYALIFVGWFSKFTTVSRCTPAAAASFLGSNPDFWEKLQQSDALSISKAPNIFMQSQQAAAAEKNAVSFGSFCTRLIANSIEINEFFACERWRELRVRAAGFSLTVSGFLSSLWIVVVVALSLCETNVAQRWWNLLVCSFVLQSQLYKNSLVDWDAAAAAVWPEN